MLGKRSSNAGKNRSSIKHDSNNQMSHKTSISMVPGLNKQQKSIVDDRKMRAEAIASLPVLTTRDIAEQFPTYAAGTFKNAFTY